MRPNRCSARAVAAASSQHLFCRLQFQFIVAAALLALAALIATA
jgi:hypothetical protein